MNCDTICTTQYTHIVILVTGGPAARWLGGTAARRRLGGGSTVGGLPGQRGGGGWQAGRDMLVGKRVRPRRAGLRGGGGHECGGRQADAGVRRGGGAHLVAVELGSCGSVSQDDLGGVVDAQRALRRGGVTGHATGHFYGARAAVRRAQSHRSTCGSMALQAQHATCAGLVGRRRGARRPSQACTGRAWHRSARSTPPAGAAELKVAAPAGEKSAGWAAQGYSVGSKRVSRLEAWGHSPPPSARQRTQPLGLPEARDGRKGAELVRLRRRVSESSGGYTRACGPN